MLPPIIITVPLFPILNALRMNDTHLLLILLYAAFYVSLGTWIMRAFVAQLPIELEEAAAVDGAGLLADPGARGAAAGRAGHHRRRDLRRRVRVERVRVRDDLHHAQREDRARRHRRDARDGRRACSGA